MKSFNQSTHKEAQTISATMREHDGAPRRLLRPAWAAVLALAAAMMLAAGCSRDKPHPKPTKTETAETPTLQTKDTGAVDENVLNSHNMPLATDNPSNPKNTGVADANSWPMFHGRPDLIGVSDSPLSKDLVLRWSFRADPDRAAVKSSPVIADGRVYFGCENGKVFALELATGRKVWEVKFDGSVMATPLVLGNTVYVGTNEPVFYALSTSSGHLRWKYALGNNVVGGANWMRSPSGDDLWVLFGSWDMKLHCLDAATGGEIWTHDLGNDENGYINGTPAMAGNKVIFGGCDEMVHVVSATDGKSLQAVPAGAYIAGSPAVVGHRAYAGNFGGRLLCIDIDTGRVLWTYGKEENAFNSSPAVGPHHLVIGSQDRLVHCVDPDTGQGLWTFATQGNVDSSPAIVGDKVVVGSNDGRLYVLRLADGELLWSYEIGPSIESSPAVAAGIIVVGANDGYVYAFGPKP
jgi:eukaryotic-like serine/threonine-protein kinase